MAESKLKDNNTIKNVFLKKKEKLKFKKNAQRK